MVLPLSWIARIALCLPRADRPRPVLTLSSQAFQYSENRVKTPHVLICSLTLGLIVSYPKKHQTPLIRTMLLELASPYSYSQPTVPLWGRLWPRSGWSRWIRIVSSYDVLFQSLRKWSKKAECNFSACVDHFAQ